jgi:hypothetical protein
MNKVKIGRKICSMTRERETERLRHRETEKDRETQADIERQR